MNRCAVFLSMLASASATFAVTAAATAAADGHAGLAASAPAERAPAARRPWGIRIEGSLVAMRDNWLSMPLPEVGLTVARDLGRRLSTELTASAREPADSEHRSWSALAAVRWVVGSSGRGRHRSTLAAGPFAEVNHVVHGTVPFAHVEVAYVHRAPSGFTVLIGFGSNIALASSSYVTPPSACGGDAIWCFDWGPEAEEIHAGDWLWQGRLALGWQF